MQPFCFNRSSRFTGKLNKLTIEVGRLQLSTEHIKTLQAAMCNTKVSE